MRYPQEVIEDVRHGNDIIEVVSGYVRLTNKGGRLFGLCPFHREKTPSFSVMQDRQLYHCFGCGASGNVISFVMQLENFAFLDAVKFLAERINYQLPELGNSAEAARVSSFRERILELNKTAARFFFEDMETPEGKIAADYLDRRGVSEQMRRRFGLGFASAQVQGLLDYLKTAGFTQKESQDAGLVLPSKRGNGHYCRFSGRLIFPIIDVRGKVVGFGGRSLDGKDPKYLNSQETAAFNKSRNLYGLNLARKAKTKEYILVEGYMDVISLHQAGFVNAVAALGTAFNIDHARTLKPYAESVVIAFDTDTAGERAALKAIPFLTGEGLRVRVLNLRGAKDPDEYVKKYGAQVFADELKKAMPHVMFRVELLRKEYDIASIDGKISFLREVAAVLGQVSSATERDVYIDAVSKLTGIDSASIAEEAGVRESRAAVGQIRPIRQRMTPRKKEDKGVESAKKNLIYIAANSKRAAVAIEKAFTPEEMNDEDYGRILTMVITAQKAGQTIVPAELVSQFEELEAQRKASDVFASPVEMGDRRLLEKCLNDFIRLIKRYNIDEAVKRLVSEPHDAANETEIRRLLESKRNLDMLYITI